jgi:hypothetical protein
MFITQPLDGCHGKWDEGNAAFPNRANLLSSLRLDIALRCALPSPFVLNGNHRGTPDSPRIQAKEKNLHHIFEVISSFPG